MRKFPTKFHSARPDSSSGLPSSGAVVRAVQQGATTAPTPPPAHVARPEHHLCTMCKEKLDFAAPKHNTTLAESAVSLMSRLVWEAAVQELANSR